MRADVQHREFAGTVKTRVAYRYLLHVPAAESGRPRGRLPLLLVLHGIGERGTRVERVAKHGPLKLLKARGRAVTGRVAEARDLVAREFIVAAPQCPPGTLWRSEHLLALIGHLEEHLRIDPRRIYVTGLSMGGFGTWDLAFRFPERLAAVAPICGGGQPVEARAMDRSRRAALRRLGIWAFHGARDPLVPLEASRLMVATCREYGVRDLRLTVYPRAAHDSWTETYSNPALYRWLLRHRL